MKIIALEPSPPNSGVALRFHYDDGSVVDVCQEIYICRIKIAERPNHPFYTDLW